MFRECQLLLLSIQLPPIIELASSSTKYYGTYHDSQKVEIPAPAHTLTQVSSHNRAKCGTRDHQHISNERQSHITHPRRIGKVQADMTMPRSCCLQQSATVPEPIVIGQDPASPARNLMTMIIPRLVDRPQARVKTIKKKVHVW